MANTGAALLAGIVIRTAIVFFVLVVSVRWSGKRQTGEMNIHDLLFVMICANAVQNAMTEQSSHLLVALVAAGTLIALGWLITALRSKYPVLQKVLVGVPTILVEHGRVIRSNMRHEEVTENELMAAVRDQGVADLSGVQLAVLETDGSISVIPRQQPEGG